MVTPYLQICPNHIHYDMPAPFCLTRRPAGGSGVILISCSRKFCNGHFGPCQHVLAVNQGLGDAGDFHSSQLKSTARGDRDADIAAALAFDGPPMPVPAAPQVRLHIPLDTHGGPKRSVCEIVGDADKVDTRAPYSPPVIAASRAKMPGFDLTIATTKKAVSSLLHRRAAVGPNSHDRLEQLHDILRSLEEDWAAEDEEILAAETSTEARVRVASGPQRTTIGFAGSHHSHKPSTSHVQLDHMTAGMQHIPRCLIQHSVSLNLLICYEHICGILWSNLLKAYYY